MDGTERLAELAREQARACADLGSPLYAELMELAAEDVLGGGPIAGALAGHENDPSSSVPVLRLFAAVHRIVLEGRAPELAAYYPSVGGSANAAAAWPGFRSIVAEHLDEVVAGLAIVPQTNEVGRAAPLLGGLLHAVYRHPLPIRLTEVGASAGLNLRADAFRVRLPDGRELGPTSSPVDLGAAWQPAAAGVLPPADVSLDVVERRGADLAPIDPTTPAGRLGLMSYVWPDQVARVKLLRGALELADRIPVEVQRQDAAEFLATLDLVPDTLLVLWHSVFWMYLDEAARTAVTAEVQRLGAAARVDRPFAYVRFEPSWRDGATIVFPVVLQLWPGGTERILGEAPAHGLPVTWF